MLNTKKTIYGCYIYPDILCASRKVLSDSEKILLSKIIILCQNKKEYCYASNSHLSRELGKSKEQITRTITRLENNGFIKRVLIRKKSKEIEQRRLTLSDKTFSIITNTPHLNNDNTPPLNNDVTNINNDNKNNIKEDIGTSNRSLLISLNELIKFYKVDDLLVDILNYFQSKYEFNRNEKYPKLRIEYWLKIIDSIKSFSCEYDLKIESWTDIIDRYFQTKFNKNCNYGLLHFISPKILENRFYEKIF
jgi:DNA-binding Lrp family transcriptional regulator